jgi:hypothetical protein
MPRNDTVLTPTPRSENWGKGNFDGIRRVFGKAIDVAGSTKQNFEFLD